MKYERTQPGNKHELTVDQHVIPRAFIQRFADKDGLVEVKHSAKAEILRLKPTNGIFCTKRVWDQRAEAGWMKKIETDFQKLTDRILSGETEFVLDKDRWTVCHFYSLWYWRSRQEPPEELEVQLKGVTGSALTLDEQERLEKLHVGFVRPGGTVPMRQITGMQLQVKVDQYAHQLKDWSWGVIQAQEGEFLVPDVPEHGMIPLTPKVALVAHHPNGTILKANLAEINVAFLAYTRRYFFAQSIHASLEGITDVMLQKAIRERDAKLAAESSAS